MLARRSFSGGGNYEVCLPDEALAEAGTMNYEL
jgi:hypothetical protein